jgi:hypothetical protein
MKLSEGKLSHEYREEWCLINHPLMCFAYPRCVVLCVLLLISGIVCMFHGNTQYTPSSDNEMRCTQDSITRAQSDSSRWVNNTYRWTQGKNTRRKMQCVVGLTVMRAAVFVLLSSAHSIGLYFSSISNHEGIHLICSSSTTNHPKHDTHSDDDDDDDDDDDHTNNHHRIIKKYPLPPHCPRHCHTQCSLICHPH